MNTFVSFKVLKAVRNFGYKNKVEINNISFELELLDLNSITFANEYVICKNHLNDLFFEQGKLPLKPYLEVFNESEMSKKDEETLKIGLCGLRLNNPRFSLQLYLSNHAYNQLVTDLNGNVYPDEVEFSFDSNLLLPDKLRLGLRFADVDGKQAELIGITGFSYSSNYQKGINSKNNIELMLHKINFDFTVLFIAVIIILLFNLFI